MVHLHLNGVIKNHSIFTNDLTFLMGVHMWFIDELRYK